MKVLLFSGSLRTGSYNKKLVALADTALKKLGHGTTVADLKSLQLPVYDGDIEAAGMPEGVKKLGALIQDAEALVISSPEYNWSMAGSLKNTLDWVSRLRPVPLSHKPILLMGASPGNFGAIRALGHERTTFDSMSCYLYPASFALMKAGEAFGDSGELKDPANAKRLEDLVGEFMLFAQRFQK